MISGIATKKIKDAISSFATAENVPISDISLFIHTKDEEGTPEYFYMVERQKVVPVNLKKDVLKLGLDFLSMEMQTQMFLKSFISSTAEAHEMHPHSVYIQIEVNEYYEQEKKDFKEREPKKETDESPQELHVGLLEGDQFKNKLTLEKIFAS